MAYSEMLEKAESDYSEYCQNLVRKLNEELLSGSAYDYADSYREATKAFESDPVRLVMMNSIVIMYSINPNPKAMIVTCKC
jgi:hypothetical protein